MPDFNITLENENILLRPMIPEDFNYFKKITNDKNLWYYFTYDLSDEIQLKEWVDSAIDQLNKKSRLPFTVKLKNENSIVGSTSLGNFSESDGRVEIGWTWLGREFQGKGINTQMKYLMLEYCFEKLDLERVEFKTDYLNNFSRKALVRIGAVEEGILRSHMLMTGNRRRDSIYYSILKSEWSSVKQRINKLL